MAYTSDLENNLDALQKELDSYDYISQEQITISALREAYAEELNGQDGDYFHTHANNILQKDIRLPIFFAPNFNGEDEPQRPIMQVIPTDIAIDIACIDNKIISVTENYAVLLSNTISRINAIKTKLFENQQLIKDINFISSAYNNLDTVIRLSRDDFSGAFDTMGNDRTFCAFTPTVNSQVPLTVDWIKGNGYLGNKYVLRQSSTTEFAEDVLDTKDFNNLVDNNTISALEYSRLCSTGPVASNNPDINHDNKNVICTIQLSSEKDFNTLLLDLNSSNLIVKDILISSDGNIYRSVFTKEREITASEYTNHNYVAGSNILSFPTTKHVQLSLSSSFTYSAERLAEYKTVVNNEDEPESTIQLLENIIRKVISINSIDAFYAVRQDNSTMQSRQLVSEQYNRIAVFANEYIPDNYDRTVDYIQYTLYVNGQPYQVEPINSDKTGTKLLSYTDYQYKNENVVYLEEPIKSAQLVITIKTGDTYSTPYVGNVKICLG